MEKMQSLEQIEKRIASKPAVLLYVSAPACSVCDALKPKVVELFTKEFPQVVLLEANIADIPELAGRFNILSAPAILLFFDGKEFAREGRNVSLELFSERVAKIYNLYFT
ncbi:thioredoxin 1 [Nitratiruptor sp. YY08-26]|uniref:thioredoxin family protein n=1 Tax=unclassified Nitratiruptor TaxID=2624044 RepID=UPI001914EF3D|nr:MULTISPECIES: thioredoxin family protein [unclassified Nitratiruptor]BCD62550.1 thioredoxin 1 [Nitratiruptor sp. YY08-13]BCD66486.1 thioredoxin 1 [Nitratiruptor sp. YY08-26]